MKLRERLLALLQQPEFTPSNENDIARLLGLKKKDRKSLAHEIRLLLSKGELRLVKGDRIALPADEDQLAGRIQFRAGGSAYFQPDVELGESVDQIQIAPDDTGVALHGDRVAVAVNAALQRRRDGRGTEQTGRVIRVIARTRDTVVGTLQKIRTSYYVRPDDPRFFHEVVVADPAKGIVKPAPTIGDKVVVKLAEWTTRHKPLEGQIVERLGRTFEPRAELAGIYHKYNLETAFPVEVEREVASLPAHDGEEIGRAHV